MSWAILKGLLPLNTKVAPRSAWVQKSLVSFVSFFSLCCFWHVIPACRHAWLPQLILFLLHKHITDHPFLSFCLSLSLSLFLCLSPHSFLSMSNNSKLLCQASVVFWMCSYLKNSIPLVSWFLFFAFWLIRHRCLPSVFVKFYYCTDKKQNKNKNPYSIGDTGLYPSQDIGWFFKLLRKFRNSLWHSTEKQLFKGFFEGFFIL